MLIAKRCLIAGRVQGVYYRASAQQEASQLGVVGYAKNLTDGRVEVLAVGEPARVAALITWLWKGSPASEVIQVDVADVVLADLGAIPRQFLTS
jgi:acylphosphatase